MQHISSSRGRGTLEIRTEHLSSALVRPEIKYERARYRLMENDKAILKGKSCAGEFGVDASFHTAEWHAARIAALTTERMSWEDWKKKQKEDAMSAEAQVCPGVSSPALYIAMSISNSTPAH